MDTKNKNQLYAIYKRRFRFKDTHRLKLKGWKPISHANGSQEKAAAAILTSENIDF